MRSAIGGGNSAAFLVKLNPTGTAAVYAAILGGRGDSLGAAVAVDSQGNAYLAGSTDAADFPVTSGAFPKIGGRQHGRVRGKAQPGGIGLGLRNFAGGRGIDRALGLAIDSAGGALVSGVTFSTDFPVTADALPKRFAGSPCLLTASTPFGNPPLVSLCGDAFAAKLDATGSTLAYSTYLSGSDADTATAVAAAAGGSMYLAGWTRSNKLPDCRHARCGCALSRNMHPNLFPVLQPEQPLRGRLPRQIRLHGSSGTTFVASGELRQPAGNSRGARGDNHDLRHCHRPRFPGPSATGFLEPDHHGARGHAGPV